MDERDPFTSAPSGGHLHTHTRFGNFDSQIFALRPSVSADQAKRALQAHLAETDRRMEEAGKVGAALVEQHKTLTEKLKEVEVLQAEGELSPELRQKLIEVEKDYTDVARESARVFLPKSRVPSNETAVAGSPFAPDGKGGRRSVSPSKFESHGTGSPTKLGVPNRKLRNQPSNRVHDIEFAAEISTSLIAQVRSLQGILSEKEEEVRDLKTEKSQLEMEAEGFQQRVRTLDESEHRYKDENWNLETQIRDLLASHTDSADREKKLGQNLTILQAEKNSALRDLDEVKLAHDKLTEENTAAAKQHDVEIGAAKRNMAMADNDRTTMQRKIDDLTSQNQELAKAFSMQRGRTLERDGMSGMSEDGFETATDNNTPENSPPPSPVKGTPRHSMLESETLRTSFQHLQRQLQLMRTNLHREKTEKLELRRILQESRDEVDRLRFKGDPGSAQAKRSKKTEIKDSKKPRPNQLGALRIPRNEVFLDDADWEDTIESPSRSTPRISPVMRGFRSSREALASAAAAAAPAVTSESEAFETAQETSDAFETANERGGTETDDFQTGAEEFSGEDTETESLVRGIGSRRSAVPIALSQRNSRGSFHSTASTSADEDEYPTTELRTPTLFPVPHKMRLKVSRGAISRRSRQDSEEPHLASSPASFGGSLGGTPQAQQSLYAELGDLDGSDEDSLVNTPSRRSVRSMTPASMVRARTTSPPPAMPPMPMIMVDMGSQTEDLIDLATPKLSLADSGVGTTRIDSESPPASPASIVTAHRPRSIDSTVDAADAADASKRLTVDTLSSGLSRPVSSVYSDSSAQYDADIERKLSLFPAPPLASPPILSPPQTLVVSTVEPIIDIEPIFHQDTPTPELALSSIASEDVAPIAAEIPQPPKLSLSALASEAVEPIPETEVPLPVLTVSGVVSEAVEPIPEPDILPPVLTVSELVTETVEPMADMELPPQILTVSDVLSEAVEPVAETEVQPPILTVSDVLSEAVEPMAETEVQPPILTVSDVLSEVVEPMPEIEAPPPALTVSEVLSEQVEPASEPAPEPPALSLSTLMCEDVEPLAEPELSPPTLSMSKLVMAEVEPMAAPESLYPSALAVPLSAVSSRGLESVEPVEVPLHTLTLSEIISEGVEPISSTDPTLQMSAIVSEGVEPIRPESLVLSLSSLASEAVEPLESKEPEPVVPELSISSVIAEVVAPVSRPATPKPDLTFSTIQAHSVSPVSPPVQCVVVAPLTLSLVKTMAATSPVSPPVQRPAPLALSSVETMATTSPISSPIQRPAPLALSSVETMATTSPISSPVQRPAPLTLSSVETMGATSPVSSPALPPVPLAISSVETMAATSPILSPVQRPALGLSSVETIAATSPVSSPVHRTSAIPLTLSSIEIMGATSPVSPRSPDMDHFIIARDHANKDTTEPHTPTEGLFNVFRNNKGVATPVIAEDETRQSLHNTPRMETPESQRPLKEVNNNSPIRPPRKAAAPMITSIDHGAQTMLTAEELDKLVAAGAAGALNPEKGASTVGAMAGSLGNTPSTVRRRRSEESVGSVIRHKGKGVVGEYALMENTHHRPGSAASARAGFGNVPPLPSNHRQAIEAARTGSSHGGTVTMGPPLLPASAMKNLSLRPRTPTSPRKTVDPIASGRGTPTPRAGGLGLSYGVAHVGSPTRLAGRSRQSSVSSFASELDSRFHLQDGITPHGFAPGTDPRMIQAITQTMIGEYLWKYTRKTASSNMSQTRHRRYFWVHPYTRTLYWSDRDPSMPGNRSEGRTKRVQIEAVRVVTDDNPYPPGLHRKSLVVIAPSRTVKFTCQTGQRHETWFNALSYLLLRTNDAHDDTEQIAGNITQEDVDEFNPGFHRTHANGNRARVPPSLSSYNSRPSVTASPAMDMSMNVPTLTPTEAHRQATHRPSMGSLSSRISGYWKAGTFGTLRTRGGMTPSPGIYEASEVHDSAEDLRHIIEQQDREADRLENVRACCDGKHDVGTLTHTKRGRPHTHHHPHSHPGNASTTSTPVSTLRSRA